MLKDENNSAVKHSVLLEDRRKMALTGVKEVLNFSDSSVSLRTVCGALLIQGKALNISRLNTDTGELYISGEITAARYSRDRGSSGFFEGLFK